MILISAMVMMMMMMMMMMLTMVLTMLMVVAETMKTGRKWSSRLRRIVLVSTRARAKCTKPSGNVADDGDVHHPNRHRGRDKKTCWHTTACFGLFGV